MSPWLLILALAGSPAANPADEPDTVLVMTSGQAMLVKSYRIEGRLAHIVSTSGEPLVMRANQIDAEKTRQYTEAHHQKLEADRLAVEAEEAAAELARLKAEERKDKNRAHRAMSFKPGFVVTDDSASYSNAARRAEPTAGDSQSDGEAQDPEGEAPDNKDQAYWQDKNQKLKDAIGQIESDLAPLRERLKRIAYELQTTGSQSLGPEYYLGQKTEVEQEIAELEAKLSNARGDHAAFLKEAKTARVPPGWLR